MLSYLQALSTKILSNGIIILTIITIIKIVINAIPIDDIVIVIIRIIINANSKYQLQLKRKSWKFNFFNNPFYRNQSGTEAPQGISIVINDEMHTYCNWLTLKTFSLPVKLIFHRPKRN